LNKIDQFLKDALVKNSSDLHFISGEPPRVRIHGSLTRLNDQPLTIEVVREALYEIMSGTVQRDFEQNDAVDFAYDIPGISRFRVNIMRHLNDALDMVRRHEYHRLAGRDRSFIKGQRYTLLSHQENLTLEGRRALRKLFKANKRLNVAYLLKESFGQLWDYETEGWARRFFDRWREALRWQRLEPYVKFADMIDRHWDGIASYCHPENKFSLGLVEGLNTKIRVLQRRAYGYRDEDYLKLKIVAAFLPPLGRGASNGPL